MHHLRDTTPWKVVTLIWPLKVIKGPKENWKIIYDFVYVFHANIGHSMHRFWDIGLNKVDADDGQVVIWKVPLPLGTETLQ